MVPACEPSTRLISSLLAVTPLRILSSDADAVIESPDILNVVAFTSPEAPYTTDFPLTILPDCEPSSKLISATFEVIVSPSI